MTKTREDLETGIVADNIRAAGIVYFVSMLEELKFYQVVDRLVEQFLRGTLPVGKKAVGRKLYDYWRQTPFRLGTAERRNFYARVVGAPGGSDDIVANRDFDHLWVRFIAAVSTFARQEGNFAQADQQVRSAARDLASNLSSHGFGPSLFAAIELKKETEQIFRLLADKDIQSSFGVRDIWQLIEEVATMDLGGAVNILRYRTQANAGATIINWLAKNSRKLTSESKTPILKLRAMPAKKPVLATNPTDDDLVNACEQWLAVTGLPDDEIDALSQPLSR